MPTYGFWRIAATQDSGRQHKGGSLTFGLPYWIGKGTLDIKFYQKSGGDILYIIGVLVSTRRYMVG